MEERCRKRFRFCNRWCDVFYGDIVKNDTAFFVKEREQGEREREREREMECEGRNEERRNEGERWRRRRRKIIE